MFQYFLPLRNIQNKKGKHFYYFNVYSDNKQKKIWIHNNFIVKKYEESVIDFVLVNRYVKFPITNCCMKYNSKFDCFSISLGNQTCFLFYRNYLENTFNIDYPKISTVHDYHFVMGTYGKEIVGLFLFIEEDTEINIIKYDEFENIKVKLKLNGTFEYVNDDNNFDILDILPEKFI